VRSALQNFVSLVATEEIVVELERNSHARPDDPVLNFARQLPLLPAPGGDRIAETIDAIAEKLFPQKFKDRKLTAREVSDARHLATAISSSAAGFITSKSSTWPALSRPSSTSASAIRSPNVFTGGGMRLPENLADVFDQFSRRDKIPQQPVGGGGRQFFCRLLIEWVGRGHENRFAHAIERQDATSAGRRPRGNSGPDPYPCRIDSVAEKQFGSCRSEFVKTCPLKKFLCPPISG